jgi:hypothetical protein
MVTKLIPHYTVRVSTILEIKNSVGINVAGCSIYSENIELSETAVDNQLRSQAMQCTARVNNFRNIPYEDLVR